MVSVSQRWGSEAIRTARGPGRRVLRSRLAQEPALLVLVALTATLDAIASILRHVNLGSGLDLAIFDQAVWHYSRFETPFSSIHVENLLGDHFHPLVAVLAPLYWVWSDPRMLVIAQAVLVAASIIPVFLFASPRLGRFGAYLLSGAYAAFWGLQVGALYDFHEVAFAPLLIALTILFADRRRWGWFWLTVVLLLGVKEDLSIYVVFLGVYLLTLREFRHGLALIVVGIAWYELATRVFIPHFSNTGGYAYWSYTALGKNLPDAIGSLVSHPWRVFTVGLSNSEKRHTVLALFAPFLLLSLRSRLIILAVPLLAERFLSSNPAMWGTHFHYSLAIAPVLAMGAAAGLSGLAARVPDRRRKLVVGGAAGAILAASFATTMINSPDSVPAELTTSSFYNAQAYAPAAYAALGHVPARASLATTDNLLPHASERDQIHQISYQHVGADEYLLANVLHPTCCGLGGDGTYVVLGQVLNKDLASMTPTYYNAGWLVARRPPAGQAPSDGALVPMSDTNAHQVAVLMSNWTAALSLTISRNFACYQLWEKLSPGATACFSAAAGPFQREQRVLARAIHTARATLHGPCSELATAALVTTHRLALDLRLLAPAAASANRAALPSALSLGNTDETNLDLTGQLERFTILCTPRSGTAGP
jgi:uncharacterized membrane protein